MLDIPYDVTEKNFCQLHDAQEEIWIKADLTEKHTWRVAYRVDLIRCPTPVLSSQYPSHIETASAPWLMYFPSLSQLRCRFVTLSGTALVRFKTLEVVSLSSSTQTSVCDKRIFSKLSVVVHGHYNSYWDLAVVWFDLSDSIRLVHLSWIINESTTKLDYDIQGEEPICRYSWLKKAQASRADRQSLRTWCRGLGIKGLHDESIGKV